MNDLMINLNEKVSSKKNDTKSILVDKLCSISLFEQMFSIFTSEELFSLNNPFSNLTLENIKNGKQLYKYLLSW